MLQIYHLACFVKNEIYRYTKFQSLQIVSQEVIEFFIDPLNIILYSFSLLLFEFV